MTEESQPFEQPVSLIMTTNLVVVEEGTLVRKAASIMAEKECGCLIVVSGYLAVGIVTERDVVRKVTAEGIDPSKLLIQDIMTTPLITVTQKATIRETAEKMSTYGVRRMVVTDETGRLVGLVTAGGLAEWLASLKNYTDPTLNAIARVKRGETGPYQ